MLVTQQAKAPGRYCAGKKLRIDVIAKFTAEVLIKKTNCKICNKSSSFDLSDDAALYILKNHDSERLCFAMDENEFDNDERDRYPVENWINGMCSDCFSKIEKAKADKIAEIKYDHGIL